MLPLLVIIVSGLVLQWKKEIHWVQPTERRGTEGPPAVSFDDILAAASGVPEAGVSDWRHIDRLDVRPGKGIVKVQCVNSWEVQVDLATGQVVSSAHRRSDLIEAIHDGSFFHPLAKHWVFFPAGLTLLGLSISGAYLWGLPIVARRSGRRRRASQGAARATGSTSTLTSAD
jgi:uncharacterized iron-regulated membrane protein